MVEWAVPPQPLWSVAVEANSQLLAEDRRHHTVEEGICRVEVD